MQLAEEAAGAGGGAERQAACRRAGDGESSGGAHRQAGLQDTDAHQVRTCEAAPPSPRLEPQTDVPGPGPKPVALNPFTGDFRRASVLTFAWKGRSFKLV